MTTHELTIAAVASAPNDESPTTQRLWKKAPPVGPDSIPIDRDQLAALRALRRVFGADQIQVLSVEPRTCYGASFENDDGYGCGVCVERATILAGYPHRLERVVTAETHTIGATTASGDACFEQAREVRDCGLRVAEHDGGRQRAVIPRRWKVCQGSTPAGRPLASSQPR